MASLILSSPIVVNGLGNVMGPFSMFVGSVIMSRYLGVEGRGEAAASLAPYLLAVAVATFGLPEAATFFGAKRPLLVRPIAVGGSLASFIVGGVACVVVVFFRDWLSNSSDVIALGIILVSLAIPPALVVGFLRALASGVGWWGRVAIEKSVGALCRLVGLAVFIALGDLTPVTAAVSLAAGPCFGLFAYLGLFYGRRQVGLSRLRGMSRQILLPVGSYSGRVWIGSIAGILLMRVDQLLLVPLSNAYSLGLYVAAVNVGEVLLIVSNTFREVVFAQGSRSLRADSVACAARICGSVTLFLCLLLAVSVDFWLPALFGDEFAAAAGMAVVMLFAVAIGVPGSIGGAALSANGQPGLRSISVGLACIVNILLLVLWVPTWGAWGAVVSTLVGNLVSSTSNLVFLRRSLTVPISSFYGLRRTDVAALRAQLRSTGV